MVWICSFSPYPIVWDHWIFINFFPLDLCSFFARRYCLHVISTCSCVPCKASWGVSWSAPSHVTLIYFIFFQSVRDKHANKVHRRKIKHLFMMMRVILWLAEVRHLFMMMRAALCLAEVYWCMVHHSSVWLRGVRASRCFFRDLRRCSICRRTCLVRTKNPGLGVTNCSCNGWVLVNSCKGRLRWTLVRRVLGASTQTVGPGFCARS